MHQWKGHQPENSLSTSPREKKKTLWRFWTECEGWVQARNSKTSPNTYAPVGFKCTFPICFLSFSLSLCLCVAQRAGVLRSHLPASLFRAPVDGPGSQPTDIRNHTKCVSRALVPTLAVYPPHVCHRQRDRAVSMGSHMQQDMGISSAPPHLSAPIPMVEHRSLQKTTIKKMAILPPETQLSSESVPARVFCPAGRHMYRIIAVYVAVINSELSSNENYICICFCELFF